MQLNTEPDSHYPHLRVVSSGDPTLAVLSALTRPHPVGVDTLSTDLSVRGTSPSTPNPFHRDVDPKI
eukprot:45964-Eustigmatos_ZCMA.PRE.1